MKTRTDHRHTPMEKLIDLGKRLFVSQTPTPDKNSKHPSAIGGEKVNFRRGFARVVGSEKVTRRVKGKTGDGRHMVEYKHGHNYGMVISSNHKRVEAMRAARMGISIVEYRRRFS